MKNNLHTNDVRTGPSKSVGPTHKYKDLFYLRLQYKILKNWNSAYTTRWSENHAPGFLFALLPSNEDYSVEVSYGTFHRYPINLSKNYNG